ncbi:MAG: transglycosylase SLT domain-containing protein [Bacteroidia bacterium]|nr:transglycosylase SLT domain-containing protein [Bacteroidia bacterium]
MPMRWTIHLLSFIATAGWAVPPGTDTLRIDYGKVTVPLNNTDRYFINNTDLFLEGVDTLTQTHFWRRLIRLSPDSGIVCLGHDRRIVEVIPVKKWEQYSDSRLKSYRDSVRKALGTDSTERVLFTKGKSNFYLIETVAPEIHRGIEIFEENGVDPFYAQAILLIESPGRLQKSTAGAYGPFQLMRRVAQHMGLKVNKHVDERKDFDKSAWAASKLIRTICIPYTNAMLEKRGIAWCETDLWYRLLVLHVYHAGAGNVEKALAVINPEVGSMELIKTLWNTRAGAFGNSSQNYSQLAIASILELDESLGYGLSRQGN